MAINDTLFTNDTGAAGGINSYVQDVFQDVSLQATSNSGLTDNSNTNPLNQQFSNDDCPTFAAKTLFIKDLILYSDRSKWVNNTPTYQVIFTENFPAVKAYIFGDIQICANQAEQTAQSTAFEQDCKLVQVKTIGGGIGVGGILSRVALLVDDTRSSLNGGTAQVVVDGVNGNTITFSNLVTSSDDTTITRYSAFVHKSSNETRDLHDIRFTANEAGTLNIVGVIAYFENSGANININPGVTYVNKSKISTTVGATFAVPAVGSSLGGNVSLYKSSSSGYQISTKSFTTVISIAQGTSGTNILNLSAGDGSKFSNGDGLVVAQGTSMYVGSILSISTDALTVSPTLSFGISNNIYRSWKSSPTLAINASFFILDKTIDFSSLLRISNGYTNGVVLNQNYGYFSANFGSTLVNNDTQGIFLGASGFLQIDGSFSAAEIEMSGSGIFHATMCINGCPAWSQNTGLTGFVRRTLLSEAGAGVNSIAIYPGASYSNSVGFERINLYRRNRDNGITFGILGDFNIHPAITERSAINATLISLGTARRLYADQLYLQGPWTRGTTSTVPGGAFYVGSTTTCIFQAQYYGKEFALLGTPGGGTFSIDGVGIGLTFGFLNHSPSLGFHTVQYTIGSGNTATLNAFDFCSPYGEMRNDQNVLIPPLNPAVDAQKVLAVYSVSADVTNAFTDNSDFSINYDLRHIDTHHAVHTGTGGAWSFCCPRSGIYDISAGWVDSLAGGSTYNIQSSLVINGITFFTEIRSGTTANTITTAGVTGAWTTHLRQGDIVTITIHGKENGAGQHTISANNGRNCVFRAAER